MKVIRTGHSPDADDAFMFYGIACQKIDMAEYQFISVIEDIESLNKRSFNGELEMTAISAAAYPQVAENYRILACGSSVGRKYGPIVIAMQAMEPGDLKGKRVAIPGVFTTANLLLRMYVSGFDPVVLPFNAITDAVLKGQVDAGLIIHEGQLTYDSMKLVKVLDLGQAWGKDTGLPIVLGVDMVHRSLGDKAAKDIFNIFSNSINYAISHEDEALDYAQQFSRDLDRETCRRFVRMYVNQDTVQLGMEGHKSLVTLYQFAWERGLIPSLPELDIVGLK